MAHPTPSKDLRDKDQLEDIFGNLGLALARTIEVAVCEASPNSVTRCTEAWKDVGGAIFAFVDDAEEEEEEADEL